MEPGTIRTSSHQGGSGSDGSAEHGIILDHRAGSAGFMFKYVYRKTDPETRARGGHEPEKERKGGDRIENKGRKGGENKKGLKETSEEGN